MRVRSYLLQVLWSGALFLGMGDVERDQPHAPQQLMRRAAESASALREASVLNLRGLAWDGDWESAWRSLRGTSHPAWADEPLAELSEGVVRMLTYNVAGLPDPISPSRPARNIPRISPLLNHYDLALVQEDFSYHAALARKTRHRYQSDPAAPFYFMNDGLNLFSEHPLGRVDRVRWNDCHGWLRYANDCLADKGFAVTEVALARGVTVDVYNLHADAGRTAQDVRARRRNFEQLARFIAQRSPDRALIVAGDFNLRPSDADDEATLRQFMARTGTIDACRTLQCGDERIDRVLLRGGGELALTPLSWAVDARFVDEAARDLSDHEAIGVVIGWRRVGPPSTADAAPEQLHAELVGSN